MQSPKTATMKKFYGLTGARLNIAIAIVAGLDFALFGYDQVSESGAGREIDDD